VVSRSTSRVSWLEAKESRSTNKGLVEYAKKEVLGAIRDIFALRAKYLYVLVNVLRYTMPRIVISDMYLKELDIR
jgi:hypothetical protein